MNRKAAKKRCEAATPGPWEFTDGFYGWDSGIFPVGCEDKLNQSIIANNGHGNGDPSKADAEFIAHARSDLPAALEIVMAAQEVWDTIPATFASDSPDFKVHSMALSELGHLLTENKEATE